MKKFNVRCELTHVFEADTEKEAKDDAECWVEDSDNETTAGCLSVVSLTEFTKEEYEDEEYEEDDEEQ